MKKRNGYVSNSSTSSFICDIKQTPEDIREGLEKIIEGFNLMMDTDYKFDNVFGTIEIATQETYQNVFSYYVEHGSYSDLFPRRNCVFHGWMERGSKHEAHANLFYDRLNPVRLHIQVKTEPLQNVCASTLARDRTIPMLGNSYTCTRNERHDIQAEMVKGHTEQRAQVDWTYDIPRNIRWGTYFYY